MFVYDRVTSAREGPRGGVPMSVPSSADARARQGLGERRRAVVRLPRIPADRPPLPGLRPLRDPQPLRPFLLPPSPPAGPSGAA